MVECVEKAGSVRHILNKEGGDANALKTRCMQVIQATVIYAQQYSLETKHSLVLSYQLLKANLVVETSTV